MNLDSDDEWGYFVDPQSFQIVEIIDEIPDGFFVVLKEREYIEDIDRTVIQSSYGIVEGKKYQPLNKREISKLMSKACADYILNSNRLPPKIMVEKELQPDKPAKLAFIMTNYDTFHLLLDKSLLDGSNPLEIINSILENETFKPTMYDREEKWKVEYAKSSRSKCKSCDSKIEKDTIRVGEPYFFENYLNYRWNHEKCIFWQRLDKEQIKGFDQLSEDDRERIEKLLE
ncbi:MAG: PARP-type zinc finger-containing protein [Candidatus Heimdallarchaeaceae archaeon]